MNNLPHGNEDEQQHTLQRRDEQYSGDPFKKSGLFSLFLGDLSYFCNEGHIQEAFQAYTNIAGVRIIRNKVTGKSLSYGFIDFSTAAAASRAMEEMNGKIICGRAVRIRWASNKETEIGDNDVIKFCLYVGDISPTIDEPSLASVFNTFGEMLSFKLKTKQGERGPVNFAFVEYSNSASALEAMKHMDNNYKYGCDGRPLRVRWASNATAGTSPISSRNYKDDRENRSAVSIFCSFSTTKIDITVTDQLLRDIFSRYAPVVDVAIRLSVRDGDPPLQRGYAFICFPDDNAGLISATRVVNEMAACEIDGVIYRCEPSKRLLERIAGSQQPQSSPVTHSQPQIYTNYNRNSFTVQEDLHAAPLQPLLPVLSINTTPHHSEPPPPSPPSYYMSSPQPISSWPVWGGVVPAYPPNQPPYQPHPTPVFPNQGISTHPQPFPSAYVPYNLSTPHTVSYHPPPPGSAPQPPESMHMRPSTHHPHSHQNPNPNPTLQQSEHYPHPPRHHHNSSNSSSNNSQFQYFR